MMTSWEGQDTGPREMVWIHDGISEKVRTQDTAHEVVWMHA